MSVHDPVVMQLAAAWGWQNPPDEVMAEARLSLRLQHCKSGEAVVVLGIASQEAVEALLAQKPANVLTFDWLSKHLPEVRDQAQRLLALSAGVQFFKTMGLEQVHECVLLDAAIARRCDALDALLVQVEHRHPVLVFADFMSMTKYTQLGREDKMTDPIRTSLLERGEIRDIGNLTLAVGERRVVNALMQELNLGVQAVVGDDMQEDVWSKLKVRSEPQRILSKILETAIDSNVTDISIAPNRDGSGSVLFRRYGEMASPPNNAAIDAASLEEMTRFLLSISRANPEGGRIREPRDGQFTYKSNALEVFLRCSFIPLDRGGSDYDMISVSLRLLPRKIGSVRLSELSMKPLAIREIAKVASFSQGLIVLAGPTNSGKSTTIAGVVGEHVRIFGNSRKRLSIEDPVERYLPGVLHISVPPHLENGFATIFRAVLRHDPDVVWIGEVRDSATASTCVRAAASGHLVFTTVHANDSVGAYKEISNMIDADKKFNLIESLSMLIAQRLVKKLCSHCAEPFAPPTDEELESFAYYCKMQGIETAPPGQVRRANPAGCPKCQAGFAGVLPLHEILPVTREVKEALMGDSNGRISYREVARHRVLVLFDSGMELVREGSIELMDILV